MCVLVCAALAWFGYAAISQDVRQKGAVSVRDAILSGAVQCCAIEGSYPSSLEYLEDHYGVAVNREDYVITYSVFAENVMPTVVVVPR